MQTGALTLSPWQLESWHGPSGWWRWAAIGTIVVLLGCFTSLVYVMGGTATVYPYFMLIPVLLSAAVFGYKGGLICGLAAGLMMGPMMPMDVAAGVAQSRANWVIRVAIYLSLGGITGGLFSRLSHHFRTLLSQAHTDPVSGLPNRQALQKDVANILGAKSPRTNGMLRVFVISIRLQNYQSTISALGFSAEHTVLREIGRGLGEVMNHLGGQVYHAGDEHFAVVLVDCSRQDCLVATQTAVATLQKPFKFHGIPVYLGAHAGVSSFPYHEREDPTRLITKAWMAMFEAGEAGRVYGSYRRRSEAESVRTVRLLGELQAAIDENQLVLHYQPKVDLHTGRLVGVEALVRWQHPERGLISPGDFICPAEQTGLIHPLTRWVLQTAIAELDTLRHDGARVPVSINVSPRNFLDPEFADNVLRTADEAGLLAGELELEFTETAVMTDPDAVIKHLHLLTQAGMDLAIDDFGTGHSSLAYLKRLPVSALKIDRTFVSEMSNNGADAQITRGSIGLAKSLGVRTVAEGVENEATLEQLESMGCDAAQGYGIARPMPAADMLRWTARG